METENYLILVVDDNPDILMATVRILRKEGYSVIQGNSGEEALELIKQHPDLLLLDVVMEGMDGFEVCQKIKSNPDYSNTFVVFTSGNKVTSSAQTEGLNLGADGYIVRPFSSAELTARVKAFLRIQKVQKKLSTSEKWLETTLISMSDAVLVTDNSGKLLFMNPAAKILTGWDFVDIINQPVDQIIRIQDMNSGIIYKDPVSHFLKESLLSKNLDDCILFQHSGNKIYVDIRTSAILDDTKKRNGVVIMIRDVSNQKKTELELAKYQDNLEEKVKERTRELEEINANLQHYHELFIKREFRIKELKDDINKLKEELEIYKNTNY